MPMDFTIKDHTDESIKAKDEAVERAFEIIGMKLEKYAKALCPVGTPESTGWKDKKGVFHKNEGYIGGTLKNSITYVTAKHDGNTVSLKPEEADPKKKLHGGKKEKATTDETECVYVGTNVFYAPYVEKGTSKMKPRPFIKPALQEHLSDYSHIMENELKKALVK